MWRYGKAYGAILFLRAGPQLLPASSVLLALALLFDGVLVYATLRLTGDLGGNAGLGVCLSLLAGLGFAYGALYLRGYPGRFVQTASALFGVDAALSFLVLLLIAPVTEEIQSGGVTSPVVGLGMLALLLWNLAAIAHIFRHALSIPLAGGFAVAIAYLTATSIVFL